jgi:4-diphosphocytidyl-2-C-methyl-D-erythritol kinase
MALAEHAPAKVNLSLAVLGRRSDGYHLLDSLVAFARLGDRLTFVPGPMLALDVRGETAAQAGAPGDNLVLTAARGLAAEIAGLKLGRFTLVKRLPVAAGLGGGSSDAADPRPRRMRGIGERLSVPLSIPPLAAVLVNPGIEVPTREVFARLGLKPGGGRKRTRRASALPRNFDGFVADLARERNDLEPAAIALQPAIARVLAALRGEPGCRLVRMSGSGATCFGLFASSRAAAAAARRLSAAHPRWWVKATVLG